MIMIIAIIYIHNFFYIFWSTIENYFQKILRLPLKKSTPPFLFTHPLKIQSARPPFLPTLKTFQPPLLAERGWEDTMNQCINSLNAEVAII